MTKISKKIQVTFWLTTILIGISSISGIFMINDPTSIEVYSQLGVSADWFRWELTLGKALGGIILLLPMIRGRVKEWVYAAFGIDFISALIALWSVNGFGQAWFVLIFIALLATSYITYHKIQGTKTPWY
jgi:hypothetical protein